MDYTLRNKLLLRIHKTTVLENLCIAQESQNRLNTQDFQEKFRQLPPACLGSLCEVIYLFIGKNINLKSE